MIGPEETDIRRRPLVVVAIAITAAAIPGDLSSGLAQRCQRTGSDARTSCQRVSAEHQRPDDRDNSTAARAPLASRAGWKLEFAAYELGNLRGAFDRLGPPIPVNTTSPFRT